MRPFLLFLLLFTLRLNAQTQFYVSPSGNNANVGSLVQPWQTIQYAVNNASAGCTIYVMGGTYQENVVIPVSGSTSNFITIKNYSNQHAIIDGSASAGGPLLHISGKSFITIEGIEFANYSLNDAQGILIDGVCGNVKIQNNKFHDINFSANASDLANQNTNAQPIIVYGDNATQAITDLYISGNEIYNCRTGYSEALAVNGNVDGFTISGNFVHDNSNIGIDVIGHEGTCPNATNDQPRNGDVKWNKTWNNISSYATSAGIYVDGGKLCVIENNTSMGNGSGIEVGCENVGKAASNITVRNNLVYRNNEGGIIVGGYDYPANSGKVDHCLIYGNTIVENNVSAQAQGELVINYTETCTWRSNLVYTSGTDFMVSSDANSLLPSFNFNLYYSTTTPQWSFNSNVFTAISAWSAAVGSDYASLVTDPLLVNPLVDNFHLQSTSPAIDMGDSTYMPAPGETDIDTMSRRQNARVDIGADEYGTAVGIQETPLVQSEFGFYDFSANQLTIHFKNVLQKNTSVYLYDAQGKISGMQEVKKGDSSVTFENIERSKGIYYAKMNQSVLKIIW